MTFSEDSDSSARSRNASETMDSENEDFGTVGRQVEPYRFKPEVSEDYQKPDEEDDQDNLTPAILEARSENQICGKKAFLNGKTSGQANLVSRGLKLHTFFCTVYGLLFTNIKQQ